jgi:7-carboxy-7-deazaguanine synthase
MDTLAVSELFGPTLQGEGPAAGRVAWFLRLMGCNLSCSWCDTPYTWDSSRFDLRAETSHRTAADIATELTGQPGILVVTGGEPLLQQDQPAFQQLLLHMFRQLRPVHMETNGTTAPSPSTVDGVQLFTVSPKLPNAGPHRGRQHPRLDPAWRLLTLQGKAVLKVVCATPDDVGLAAAWAEDAGVPLSQLWVMPEGTTSEVLAQRWPAIADAAAERGINASHRLHVLAWGDKRGH